MCCFNYWFSIKAGNVSLYFASKYTGPTFFVGCRGRYCSLLSICRNLKTMNGAEEEIAMLQISCKAFGGGNGITLHTKQAVSSKQIPGWRYCTSFRSGTSGIHFRNVLAINVASMCEGGVQFCQPDLYFAMSNETRRLRITSRIFVR